jgi:AcrR family transcriptional regulator
MTDRCRPRMSLRERNKQSARETIVRVAADLFSERGYATTTLADIADAAGLAPSTLFNYYPSKSDIVFSLFNDAIESAERRIVGRPEGEPATAAVIAWVKEDLPVVEAPYVDSLRRMPRIVSSDPGLCAENRLRRALLEDVFAAAYARDLGEPAEHLRPHVMATIVMRGILDVWEVWDLRQNGRTATTTDLGAVTELKAAYLERVLEAGLAALDTLATVE